MPLALVFNLIYDELLFTLNAKIDRTIPSAAENVTKKTVQLDASTVEIEERGVKLRLTVVDTPGFGDAIDNTDSFQQIIRYIDEQFERFKLKNFLHMINQNAFYKY